MKKHIMLFLISAVSVVSRGISIEAYDDIQHQMFPLHQPELVEHAYEVVSSVNCAITMPWLIAFFRGNPRVFKHMNEVCFPSLMLRALYYPAINLENRYLDNCMIASSDTKTLRAAAAQLKKNNTDLQEQHQQSASWWIPFVIRSKWQDPYSPLLASRISKIEYELQQRLLCQTHSNHSCFDCRVYPGGQ